MDLLQIAIQNTPWFVIGDFNAVIGAHEKKSGPPPLNISCDEFVDFTNACDLIHIDTVGTKLTWTNGRKGRSRTDIRLDRAIFNTPWYSVWSVTFSITVVGDFLHHRPLLLYFDLYIRIFPKYFKFILLVTKQELHGCCEGELGCSHV